VRLEIERISDAIHKMLIVYASIIYVNSCNYIVKIDGRDNVRQHDLVDLISNAARLQSIAILCFYVMRNFY
jgi:hypothetical protein